MVFYKLMRKRKDGTLGSLFINRSAVVPVGVVLVAEDHPTDGYAHRPGWHGCSLPYAPHLKQEGRVWVKGHAWDYEVIQRPMAQGGEWIIAQKIKIVEEITHEQAQRISKRG